jgi:subtilisin family serine protease
VVLTGTNAYAQLPAGSFVADELVVKFKYGISPSPIDAAIAECGTETKLDSSSLIDTASLAPIIVGSLPTDIDIQARNLYWLHIISPAPDVTATIACFMAHTDIVEFAEPNFLDEPSAHQANNYPNDPQFMAGRQWGLHNAGQRDPPPLFVNGNAGNILGTIDADIDTVQAWDLPNRDCRNAVTAVFDTGADLTHPDLINNIWVNGTEIPANGIDDDGNGFIDDVNGFDFTQATIQSIIPFRIRDTGGDGPRDTLVPIPAGFGGHGTHVAGIIGAEGNNGRDITGICWRANLMIIRIGDPSTSNMRVFFSSLYTLLQKFVFGHNVRVINLSYGIGGGALNSLTLRLMFNLTAAGDILFVKAAANNGRDIDIDANGDGLPDFPVYPCNSPERTANVICVAASNNRDVVATGATSNANSNFGATSVDLAAPGENIDSLALAGGRMVISGTSMATPHVSGIAALAFTLFPGKTALQVKHDILFGNAGSPVASGTDVIKTNTANTIFGRVITNGRLRWPYTGDLGDAPVTYDTVASPAGGALHWDIGNEYFGRDATPEVDANTAPPLDQDPTANIIPVVNHDLADYPLGPGDGRFTFKPPPLWKAGQRVDVAYDVCSDHLGINDADGGRYQGGNGKSGRTLYVNAWFDMNRNGIFDATELLLEDIISPPPASPILPKPANINVTANQQPVLLPPVGAPVFPPNRLCIPIASHFNVPPPGGIPLWIRFRLDYGEDIMANNPDPVFRPDRIFPMFQHLHWARYGEIEDFRLCDIDANDHVDRNDIAIIFNGRSSLRVQSGDPRDIDGNGIITVNDARACTLQCDNERCAL